MGLYVTEVICAVMMQSVRRGMFLQIAATPPCSRLFGDVCEGELLMQCKSNLAPGRCTLWCLLCVFLYEMSLKRKELLCS